MHIVLRKHGFQVTTDLTIKQKNTFFQRNNPNRITKDVVDQ